MVHRSLSPSTIFFDPKSQNVKLSNWFLWTLSDCGQMSPFDNNSNIKYLPVEDVVKILRNEKKPRLGCYFWKEIDRKNWLH